MVGRVILYNREIECMEQYPYHVLKMGRTRGGICCNCEEGNFLLKEYEGNEKRIQLIQQIQKQGEEKGFVFDTFVNTQENTLLGADAYGKTYTLRKWHQERECDPRCPEDILEGARLLGKITLFFQEVSAEYKKDIGEGRGDFSKEVLRRNKELKSISNSVKRKKKKTEFDETFRRVFSHYYEQGLQVAEECEGNKDVREGICHKDYTHHNVMIGNETMVLVHFDNLGWDDVVGDLSLYLRKIMEKNEWDTVLAERILKQFHSVFPLSKAEYRQLYLRMAYPVRFLKIANHYGNTKRNHINLRDLEKLKALEKQENLRQQFLVFLHEFVV